jgi:hypothetical protein
VQKIVVDNDDVKPIILEDDENELIHIQSQSEPVVQQEHDDPSPIEDKILKSSSPVPQLIEPSRNQRQSKLKAEQVIKQSMKKQDDDDDHGVDEKDDSSSNNSSEDEEDFDSETDR